MTARKHDSGRARRYSDGRRTIPVGQLALHVAGTAELNLAIVDARINRRVTRRISMSSYDTRHRSLTATL